MTNAFVLRLLSFVLFRHWSDDELCPSGRQHAVDDWQTE